MLTKQELLNLLRTDVVPALGCTEPVCVALCAAYAGKAILKNPEKQLKLLEDLTPELLQKASVLVSEGKTQVSMDPQIQGLYVKGIIKTMTDSVVCIIRNAHTNMVYLEKNGVILFEKESSATSWPVSEFRGWARRIKRF